MNPAENQTVKQHTNQSLKCIMWLCQLMDADVCTYKLIFLLFFLLKNNNILTNQETNQVSRQFLFSVSVCSSKRCYTQSSVVISRWVPTRTKKTQTKQMPPSSQANRNLPTRKGNNVKNKIKKIIKNLLPLQIEWLKTKTTDKLARKLHANQ